MKFTKKIIIGAIAALLAFSSIGCSMNKEEVYVLDFNGWHDTFTIHSDNTAEWVEFRDDYYSDGYVVAFTIVEKNKDYWLFNWYSHGDVNGEIEYIEEEGGYLGVFIDDALLLADWNPNDESAKDLYERFINIIYEKYDYFLGKDSYQNGETFRRKK